MISDFGRDQRADAWFTCSLVSTSPVSICLPGTSSFRIRMGSVMWSEYLRRMARRRVPDSSSSSPLRRCSVTSVPRAGFEAGAMEYSPSPPLSQRTASSAASPARRVVRVTRSATMNDE